PRTPTSARGQGTVDVLRTSIPLSREKARLLEKSTFTKQDSMPSRRGHGTRPALLLRRLLVLLLGVVLLGVVLLGVVLLGVILLGVILLGVVLLGVILLGVVLLGVVLLGVVLLGVLLGVVLLASGAAAAAGGDHQPQGHEQSEELFHG